VQSGPTTTGVLFMAAEPKDAALRRQAISRRILPELCN
jgi:hypothetical protein